MVLMKTQYFIILMIICSSQFVISSKRFERISACIDNNIADCYRLGCRSVNFICGEIDNEYKQLLSSSVNCFGDGIDKSNYGMIGFENCEFKKFEKNVFKTFPNLHTLNIANVQLETLHMKTFSEANEKLKTFIAHSNHLTEIPAHVFVHAENIISVDFSNNSINRIDVLAFDGLNYLNTVNLSRNFISQLDSQCLSVPSLSVLDLSYNNLSYLNENIFRSDLKQLDLSYNPIGNLRINTFAFLTNLEYLNLRHTNITSIELGTFSHQHKLILLILSENNLKALNFNLFLPILHDLQSLIWAKTN